VRVRILGKYWNLRRVPNLGSNKGICQHPDSAAKEIHIQSGLRGEQLLETVIHEVLHAANWHLDEEFVTDFARDVTKILKRKPLWERIVDPGDK
jgi:hypothetical protein